MRLDAVTDILIEDRRGVACSSSQDLLLSTSEPTSGIPRSNSVCVCVCVYTCWTCTCNHISMLRRGVKVAEVTQEGSNIKQNKDILFSNMSSVSHGYYTRTITIVISERSFLLVSRAPPTPGVTPASLAICCVSFTGSFSKPQPLKGEVAQDSVLVRHLFFVCTPFIGDFAHLGTSKSTCTLMIPKFTSPAWTTS